MIAIDLFDFFWENRLSLKLLSEGIAFEEGAFPLVTGLFREVSLDCFFENVLIDFDDGLSEDEFFIFVTHYISISLFDGFTGFWRVRLMMRSQILSALHASDL